MSQKFNAKDVNEGRKGGIESEVKGTSLLKHEQNSSGIGITLQNRV